MAKSKRPTEDQIICAIRVALRFQCQSVSVLNVGSNQYPCVDIRVVSIAFMGKSIEEREQIVWLALERSGIEDARNIIKPNFMLLTPAELDDILLGMVHSYRFGGDLCKCDLS